MTKASQTGGQMTGQVEAIGQYLVLLVQKLSLVRLLESTSLRGKRGDCLPLTKLTSD